MTGSQSECMPLTSDSSVLLLTSLDGGAGAMSHGSIFGPASARIHLQPLYRAAENLGLNPSILSLDVNEPNILNKLGKPQICVIGKINHHDDSRIDGFAMAVLAAVSRLKACGVKIVVSYCDNLAPLSCSRGFLYRDLLKLADHLIVPCQAMASLARRWTHPQLPILIINDPWQVRLQPYPALAEHDPLNIVWFGNTNNIYYFCKEISRLVSATTSAVGYRIDVLSSPQALEMSKKEFFSAFQSAQKPWTIRLIPWDKSAQPRQLEEVLGPAHIAWLPSDPRNIVKAGVSHNRLVDSIRSGCIPVASPMTSYLELSRLALLGTDHASIINDLLPHYSRIASKHQGLRESLLSRFDPSVNLTVWEEFLTNLISHKKATV